METKVADPEIIGTLNRLGASVTGSGAQTISNATETLITWNAAAQFNEGLTFTQTSTLTVPVAGIYLANALITWILNSTGARQTTFSVNGTLRNARSLLAGNANTDQRACAVDLLILAANDTVAVSVRQTSTANLNVTRDSSFFSLNRIR